ncbi:MAG: cobalamin-independent methionine synthase II family protein [Acidobacteriota bacterium]|nr:cobalamin-independent methionine synthase II family protein [Acidobacteriota bacterium]
MRGFRADVVGSMLRPQRLLDAKRERRRGDLTAAEFKAIEDAAVDECVAIQERAGVDVVTDGEMRRHMFASQLAQATEGFEPLANSAIEWKRRDGDSEDGAVAIAVTSKLRRRRHLSAEELVYLRARTDRPTKITLPSPTMYTYYWLAGASEAAYPNPEAYLADVADILRDEVTELVRLGATYVQFDAPELAMLLDADHRQWLAARGIDPESVVPACVEMINGIISGHSELTTALHICRGNNRSMYVARGGYASIAEQTFPHVAVDRLLLEYDDERSGDFSPLRNVPDDKTVVLGLVTTKWARAETVEELEERVREASAYQPLERLALSPQCGFASVDKGNDITFEVQEAKLGLVARVADRIWSEADA